jgi:hypothetical protein
MKGSLTFILCVFSALTAFAQQKEQRSAPDLNQKKQLVEAACGQCKFGMEGRSCDLAVRINGKAYFVKGTNIDSHGDAHAEDGFCNAIRKAEVQGEVRDNFFVASYFKLQRDSTQKK